MKLVKKAGQKDRIVLTRSEWEEMGRQAGWMGDRISDFKEWLRNLKDSALDYLESGITEWELTCPECEKKGTAKSDNMGSVTFVCPYNDCGYSYYMKDEALDNEGLS